MKRQTSQQLAACRRDFVRLIRLAYTGGTQVAFASHLRIPLCASGQGTPYARSSTVLMRENGRFAHHSA